MKNSIGYSTVRRRTRAAGSLEAWYPLGGTWLRVARSQCRFRGDRKSHVCDLTGTGRLASIGVRGACSQQPLVLLLLGYALSIKVRRSSRIGPGSKFHSASKMRILVGLDTGG